VTPAIQLRDENRLVTAHIYTATAAIALGAVFGVFQGFARAGAFGAPAWFDYYRVLTLHGVLMALVFTTLFITGLSLFATYRAIPRERSLAVGWFGWSLMLLGTAMAALTILRGNATVLYTFYAPLKASPWFYIGATLLVLGTWVVAFEIFENVCFFRKAHVGQPTPLVVFCAAATFVMRKVATLGVVAEMAF
jgi:cytochrome c oxidase subunit 1